MLRTLLRLLLASALATTGAAWAQAAEGKTEVLWLGQSAFRITTPGGKVIVTDPWLKANPLTPPEYKKLENNEFRAHLKYEKREPLIQNLDLVARFDKEFRVRMP